MNRIVVLLVLLLFWSSLGQNIDHNDVATLFPRLPVAATDSKNDACARESRILLEELNNMTMWAAKMWDATAKSVVGTLVGNIHQMGDFYECTEAVAPFATQYCLVTIYAHTPSNYSKNNSILERFAPHAIRGRQQKNFVKTAWCIPASCAVSDLEQSLTTHLKTAHTSLSEHGVTYSAQISEEDCTIREDLSLDKTDIAFCLLTAFLIVLVVAATIYHSYTESTGKRLSDLPHAMFVGFSAKKNMKDLLEPVEATDCLAVLHGIRAIFCLLVILTHEFIMALIGNVVRNLDYFESFYGGHQPWIVLLFYHVDLAIDTFFGIGGLLTAYQIFKVEVKAQTRPWKLVLYRFMRLTPVYAYVLFYYATLFNLSGSGPLWKRGITPQRNLCRQNWFLNLFYVHNYIRDTADQWCMIHTWYLCCDFHFFILGVFICVLIKRRRKLGLALLFAVFNLSVAVTFAKIYFEKRPAFLPLDPMFILHQDFQATYTKSHLRATPYLVGIFAGYLYHKYQIWISKCVKGVRSLVVLALSFTLIFGTLLYASVFCDHNREYNAFQSALYAALSRVFWAVGNSGVLFVITHGSINTVKKILSSKVWVPLSKLSYAAYVVHIQFEMRTTAMTTSPIDFNVVTLFPQALGEWMMSIVAAVFLYVVVEAPFKATSKLVLMLIEKPMSKGSNDGKQVHDDKRKVN